jgi:hypothetical protein
MLISPKPVLSNKDEYWAVRTETYWDRSYLKVVALERMGAEPSTGQYCWAASAQLLTS